MILHCYCLRKLYPFQLVRGTDVIKLNANLVTFFYTLRRGFINTFSVSSSSSFAFQSCKMDHFLRYVHCKYLNAWFECNDIVIFIYSHYPLDPKAKSSDTKSKTFSIRWFCIRIERVMTVYENYNVNLAFRNLQWSEWFF